MNFKQESWVIAKMTAQCAICTDALKIFGSRWLHPRLLFPKFLMGLQAYAFQRYCRFCAPEGHFFPPHLYSTLSDIGFIFQQDRNTLWNWPLNCDVQSSRAVRILYRPLTSGYRRADCIMLTSHVELEDILSARLRISLTDKPCYISLFTELGNPLLHKSVSHDYMKHKHI